MEESRNGFYFIFLHVLCLQGQFSAAGAVSQEPDDSAKTGVADKDFIACTAAEYSSAEHVLHNRAAASRIANGRRQSACSVCEEESPEQM